MDTQNQDAGSTTKNSQQVVMPSVVHHDTAGENRALNSAFLVVTYTCEGKIKSANFRFLQKFSCHLIDILGDDSLQFLSKSQARDHMCSLWSRLQLGHVITDTGLWISKTGQEIWLESRFIPVLSANQTVECIVQIAEDVSERLKLESDSHSQIDAIQKSHAVAHFSTDKKLLWANDVFYQITGYDASELLQTSHDLLCTTNLSIAKDSSGFWSNLYRGEHESGEYLLIKKDGTDLWIQAVYTPILDPANRITKVVLYATDITIEKLNKADYQSQIAAINKSSCVITFDMSGTIIDANTLFLQEMGYELDEIQGKHHRLFVDASYSHSTEYATFWGDLRRGKYRAGLFKRIAKNGQEVWLQATYNPVFDTHHQPIKIVKYANNVTDEKQVQAEHQGQIAAINQSNCVIAFDLNGNVLDANDRFLSLMGYRYSEVLGKHHQIFVDPMLANSQSYRDFWHLLAQGKYQAGEYKRFTKSRKEVWLQATYNPICDVEGRVIKIIKYASDITANKLVYADFQGQIEAIRKSQDVIVFDLQGYIVDVNDRMLRTLGYKTEELMTKHHSMLVDRNTAASSDYIEFWKTLKAGHHVAGLYRRLGKGGKELWLQASYNPILDMNGEPFKIVKFATDVTQNIAMAEAFEQSRRESLIDAVTSLPNRAKLTNFMGSYLAVDGSVMTVIYIDIDQFSQLNEQYGRRGGDRVLAETADRIRRSLRQDQMVARVGGDEFVIAAPGMLPECVERFCNELMEKISTPILITDEQEMCIGVSLGVALAPSDGQTPDELLHSSDLALSVSKKQGGGIFSYFAEEYNTKIYGKRQLTEEMRHSLAAGNFFLEYQPRFNAKTRHIESAEALVRWSHPERGRISPAEFIPLAEQTGLIVPLSEWILRTACIEAAQWKGVGVSVNLSPVQFNDTQLILKIMQVLSDAGLAPYLLELEVTEGVLVGDSHKALTILNDLKSIGVKLAIDDFGTGYSSLSYLRNFPFDVIKIDRSFVKDLDIENSSRSVVQAIIALGKAIGLSVTAEGVESREQLDLLVDDGCDEIQGFLLGMPTSATELRAILSKNISG